MRYSRLVIWSFGFFGFTYWRESMFESTELSVFKLVLLCRRAKLDVFMSVALFAWKCLGKEAVISTEQPIILCKLM